MNTWAFDIKSSIQASNLLQGGVRGGEAAQRAFASSGNGFLGGVFKFATISLVAKRDANLAQRHNANMALSFRRWDAFNFVQRALVIDTTLGVIAAESRMDNPGMAKGIRARPREPRSPLSFQVSRPLPGAVVRIPASGLETPRLLSARMNWVATTH